MHHFKRVFAIGEDGDAVEALLAVPRSTVADLLELFCREALILALDLLETGDRRARLLEPFEKARQPRLDAVDVE